MSYEPITKEYLFNKGKEMFESHNLKLYNISIPRYMMFQTDILYDVINNKNKILYAFIKAIKEYDRKIDITDVTLMDIYHYLFKSKCISFGVKQEDIREMYVQPYEQVEERMFFRIELYKNGWEIPQIEHYIYKTFLKVDKDIKNITLYETLYHNMSNALQLCKKIREKKIGRPTLPCLLKEIILNKNKEKVKGKMKEKYSNSNNYIQLEKHLLTKEEYTLLEKELSFKEEFTQILTKLKNIIKNK